MRAARLSMIGFMALLGHHGMRRRLLTLILVGGLLHPPVAIVDGLVRPPLATASAVAEGSTDRLGSAAAVSSEPVERIAGDTRLTTATAVARRLGAATTVVLARHDAYPDALAGAALARSMDAPLLLSRTSDLPVETAEVIRELGATRAVLLGGTSSLSSEIDAALEQLGVTDRRRVAGPDRFSTAAQIGLLAAPVQHVLVAEGANADPQRGWPDALSASALSAHTGWPLLLATASQLPAASEQALIALDPQAVTIVGGPAAVSEAVEEHIRAVLPDAAVQRLAGPDRYATSAAIAARGVEEGMDPLTTWLATGRNWPDALTGAPAVAAEGGALLLVDGERWEGASSVRDWIRSRLVGRVLLLGGTATITSPVEAGIRGLFDTMRPAFIPDPGRAVTAPIGRAGGQIVVKGADSRTYTLDVPPGALAVTTHVTVTPVTAPEGLAGSPVVGGVDLGPDGTILNVPASLTVTSTDTPPPGLAGFIVDDAGVAHLTRAQIRPSSYVVQVPHFSGAGGTDTSSGGAASTVPATPGTSAHQRLAEHRIALFWHDYLEQEGEDGNPNELPKEWADRLHTIFIDWFNSIVGRLDLQGSSSSPNLTEMRRLISELGAWHGSAQLNIVDPDDALWSEVENSWDRVATILRRIYDAAHARCLETRVWDGIVDEISIMVAIITLWDTLALPEETGSSPRPTLDEVNEVCVTAVISDVRFDPGELGADQTSVDMSVDASLHAVATDTAIREEPLEADVSLDNGTANPSYGAVSEPGPSPAVGTFRTTLTVPTTVDGIAATTTVSVPGLDGVSAVRHDYLIRPAEITVRAKPSGASDDDLTNNLGAAAGSTAELVIDVSRDGQPLVGRQVSFSAAGPGTLGTEPSTRHVTDGAGQARTTFIAGGNGTVTITATLHYLPHAEDPPPPTLTATATIVVGVTCSSYATNANIFHQVNNAGQASTAGPNYWDGEAMQPYPDPPEPSTQWGGGFAAPTGDGRLVGSFIYWTGTRNQQRVVVGSSVYHHPVDEYSLYARRSNEAGDVIGEYAYVLSGPQWQGWFRIRGGELQLFPSPDLPNRQSLTRFHDLAEDGSVVGYRYPQGDSGPRQGLFIPGDSTEVTLMEDLDAISTISPDGTRAVGHRSDQTGFVRLERTGDTWSHGAAIPGNPSWVVGMDDEEIVVISYASQPFALGYPSGDVVPVATGAPTDAVHRASDRGDAAIIGTFRNSAGVDTSFVCRM